VQKQGETVFRPTVGNEMRLEIFAAVKIHVVVFCVMIPCHNLEDDGISNDNGVTVVNFAM
jgi:hypothetical protein